MHTTEIIAVVVGGIVMIVEVGNIRGWYICREYSRRESRKLEPFNWRVFFGPQIYYNWYERDECR